MVNHLQARDFIDIEGNLNNLLHFSEQRIGQGLLSTSLQLQEAVINF